ncbi:MAG: response regulator [Candidatus Bipolaricaulia bacterium]
MDKIRVLVADDHTLVRQGLTQLLEAEDIQVVGEAADGEEACRLALFLKPDVVLMDISMPRRDGIEATRCITAKEPKIKVLILTMHRRDDYVFRAIKAGASGYILKEADSKELLRAIRAAYCGEALLEPGMARKILEEFRRLGSEEKAVHLTVREREILQLVARGASNQKIAEELGIAEKTVRNRLSVIFTKLHINNRTQAALYALREGLVPPDEPESRP